MAVEFGVSSFKGRDAIILVAALPTSNDVLVDSQA